MNINNIVIVKFVNNEIFYTTHKCTCTKIHKHYRYILQSIHIWRVVIK